MFRPAGLQHARERATMSVETEASAPREGLVEIMVPP